MSTKKPAAQEQPSTEQVEEQVTVEPDEFASKQDMSDGMAMLAKAVEAISARNERPVNVDVSARKKRVRTAELQAKIDKANEAEKKLVVMTIDSPANDLDAARGFETITQNGKNYKIKFDVPVKIPKSVLRIYNERKRLEAEATKRRRAAIGMKFLGER